jgi:hypothetical protein
VIVPVEHALAHVPVDAVELHDWIALRACAHALCCALAAHDAVDAALAENVPPGHAHEM